MQSRALTVVDRFYDPTVEKNSTGAIHTRLSKEMKRQTKKKFASRVM